MAGQVGNLMTNYSTISHRIARELDQTSRPSSAAGEGFAACSAVCATVSMDGPEAAYADPHTIARLYRSFTAVTSDVFASGPGVRTVGTAGDTVWAVFDSRLREDIDAVFRVICRARTTHLLLNEHTNSRGLGHLSVGIGAEWGQLCRIDSADVPAEPGAGAHHAAYLGKPLVTAARLARQGTATFDYPIRLGRDFAANLSAENRALVYQDSGSDGPFKSDGLVIEMKDWISREFA